MIESRDRFLCVFVLIIRLLDVLISSLRALLQVPD